MGGFRRLFHLGLWRPGVDEGIDWEIRHHLEERMDELKASGMSEAEAEREAGRRFGDRARVRSELRRIDRGQRRTERLFEFMGTIRQDIRYGARGLVHNAGFAAAVVLTLGLGIGANAALFSVADALLLRPLPYASPAELVQVEQVSPQEPFGRPYIPPAIAREWLAQQTVLPAAFLSYRGSVTYTGGVEPVRLPGESVTEGFLETLGVRPVAGRGLLAEDMTRGAPPVVLVSWEFASSVAGGALRGGGAGGPAGGSAAGAVGAAGAIGAIGAVGAEIALNGVRHTVVGVMPRGFKFPQYSTTDVWLPLYDDNVFQGRPLPFVGITARAAGGDVAAAEPVTAALGGALIRERRPDSEASFTLVRLDELRARSPELRQAMKLLAGAVTLILLIAGVNTVNLLLLRGSARTREIAVRLALGASRGRLVRQLGTEAMLLAVLSGVVATLLAAVALRLVQQGMPSSIVFYAAHAIELETRTLLFTFGLALASGFIFGMLPAVRATRLGGRATGGGLAIHARTEPAGSGTLRRMLVTSEVALSVTLLVGAGLLIGSFVRLTQVAPGVELDRLAVLNFSIAARDYPEPAQRAAYLELLESRVGAIPGVVATTMTGGLPPRGGGIMFTSGLQAEGEAARAVDTVLPTTSAGPGFFDVTGARLRSGRPFTSGDGRASGNVIIDEELAAFLWPAGSVLGQRFRVSEQDEWLTVVGVMETMRLLGPAERRGRFMVVYPMGTQEEITGGVLAIRTAGDPAAVLPAVRAAVHEINPRQVIDDLATARAQYAGSLDMQRFLYVIITALSALALVLTAVGLYGLLAYGVARRRREIGVRLALGASGAHVRRVVLGEALALTAAGAVIGAAGALALSRFIEATLYGITPGDPRTFAAAGAVIFAVAVLASVLPARRAAAVDPAGALRAE